MSDTISCAYCQGAGTYPYYRDGTMRYPCEVCDQSGEFDIPEGMEPKLCKPCKGSGRTIFLDIPIKCNTCGGKGFTDFITKSVQVTTGLIAHHFAQGQPYTAQVTLDQILQELVGDVRICDPYLTRNTLGHLKSLIKANKVDFVFKKCADNSQQLLVAFTKQHHNFHFFKTTMAIHDRFIITTDELILLGHGFGNIGEQDSFLIRLDQSIARGLIQSTRARFNDYCQNLDPNPCL